MCIYIYIYDHIHVYIYMYHVDIFGVVTVANVATAAGIRSVICTVFPLRLRLCLRLRLRIVISMCVVSYWCVN